MARSEVCGVIAEEGEYMSHGERYGVMAEEDDYDPTNPKYITPATQDEMDATSSDQCGRQISKLETLLGRSKDKSQAQKTLKHYEVILAELREEAGQCGGSRCKHRRSSEPGKKPDQAVHDDFKTFTHARRRSEPAHTNCFTLGDMDGPDPEAVVVTHASIRLPEFLRGPMSHTAQIASVSCDIDTVQEEEIDIVLGLPGDDQLLHAHGVRKSYIYGASANFSVSKACSADKLQPSSPKRMPNPVRVSPAKPGLYAQFLQSCKAVTCRESVRPRSLANDRCTLAAAEGVCAGKYGPGFDDFSMGWIYATM